MAEQVIRISDNIIPAFLPYFNSKTPRQIDEGGRGSTKTSKNAIKIVFSAIAEQKCSIVVMRKNTNKIRRSVFNETKKACSRLGLLQKVDYKSTVSPFQIKILSNGNNIYFTGIDSIDDIKGMVDEDRPIKIVWIEELTEFFEKSLEEGEEAIDNIEATFSRGNNDWFLMLFSFNPPRNPNHPVMQWLNKMNKRNDVIHTHTTYLDVPKEWLGTMFIKQAESLKESDEELYRHIYLGECVGTKGRIYKIKDEYVKPIRMNSKGIPDYDFYTMAIDIGASKSATTFALTGYKYVQDKLVAQLLEENYHRNSDLREIDQLSPDEYAGLFVDFYLKCYSKYKKEPIQIRIDQDPIFKKALKKKFSEYDLDFSKVKYAIKNEINIRIKAFNWMLPMEHFSFSPNVPITIQAFKDALWNEKKALVGIDERLDDLTTNIDSLDCCEYSIEPFFNKIINSAVWRKEVNDNELY